MTIYKATTGDYVRSFDFPQHRELDGKYACYIEGIVVSVDKPTGHVEIEPKRQVFGGEEVHLEDVPNIFPPQNGREQLFHEGVTDGIELIRELT